jgi:hypothetical protein
MFGLVPAIVVGGVVTLAVAALWAKGLFSHVVAIADFSATQGSGNGWHITDRMRVTTPTPARIMTPITTTMRQVTPIRTLTGTLMFIRMARLQTR